MLDFYAQQLETLKQQGNFRQFTQNHQTDKWITIEQNKMLNLSSNDYLGLASNTELKTQFLQQSNSYLSSSSSRLLTGNFAEYEACEASLSKAFNGRSALLFNSGYHMNIGILPAMCDSKTLILADKLVHASMIDGIRLSTAKYVRYRHNDLTHLEKLIEQNHDTYERIVVVTESIFSMDGDETDLTALVAIKNKFSRVMLYVDEAHAIGVRGTQGLGCAEQYNVLDEIDFLVGTFGKALASVGGYLICHSIIREFLINTMRPLIFSTALPPLNIAWTQYVFEHMQTMQKQRAHLQNLSDSLQQHVLEKGYQSPSTSHLVPVIVGESTLAVQKAKTLQQQGFYIMPVRPPTVPKNSARLRISLSALIQHQDLELLIKCL